MVLKHLSGAGSEAWLRQAAHRAQALSGIGHPALPHIFEVTQEEYQRVMGRNPSSHSAQGARKGEEKGPPLRFIDVPPKFFDPQTSGIRTTTKKGVNPFDIEIPAQ